jgi:hypothetical protein
MIKLIKRIRHKLFGCFRFNWVRRFSPYSNYDIVSCEICEKWHISPRPGTKYYGGPIVPWNSSWQILFKENNKC